MQTPCMGAATSRVLPARQLCQVLAPQALASCLRAPHHTPHVTPALHALHALCPSSYSTHSFATAAQPSHLRRVGRSTTVRVGSAAAVFETEEDTEAAPAANTPQDPLATTPSGFSEFGLRPQLVEALQAANINSPTEVQKLAIPALIKGGDFLMTSHTGSGKTLAYLLPIIHQLKQEEDAGFVPAPKRPRVLVLGPTKELTEQITSVAKLLSHYAKFRVVCGNTGNRTKAMQENMLQRVDMMVTSPTKLLTHLKDQHIYLRDVRWLVVDEADTVFAEGWGAELGELLTPLRSKAQPANVVLVSATMTKPIKRLLSAQFPTIQALQTSSTHKGIRGSQHTFTTLPNGMDKLGKLAEILAADGSRRQKAIVFCNSVDSCRAVEHYCRENNIPTVCYHGDMAVAARQESMKTFSEAQPGVPGTPVMIATDVAARGLDFSGHVHHVINFDFPYTAVDYIHRSGRTARAGRSGHVTSIVTKRDKVLAQRIEWALEHNESLDQLSSDPNVLPPSQRPEPRRDSGGRGADRRSSSGGRGGGRQGCRQGGGRGGARGAGRSSGEGRREERVGGPGTRGAARFAAASGGRGGGSGQGRGSGRGGERGQGSGRGAVASGSSRGGSRGGR